jgi:hypothetical protein
VTARDGVPNFRGRPRRGRMSSTGFFTTLHAFFRNKWDGMILQHVKAIELLFSHKNHAYVSAALG